MNPIPTFHIDAFTLGSGISSGSCFSGNPAAVCLLEEPADPAWMQAVAEELNLSETAFIHQEGEGFRLRWFTPKVEVPLCGHATLAGAHALWESGALARDIPARFFTLSGELLATSREEWIELNFPSKPVHHAPPPRELLEAMGVSPLFVGSDGANDLIQVATEEEVKAATPDLARLRGGCPFGVILTALSSLPSSDFVSRYFAPSLGIDEDPVTGSAHCALGPFWQARLGRDALVGRQVSRRGGVVKVEMRGERILLSGKATTVMKGELFPK